MALSRSTETVALGDDLIVGGNSQETFMITLLKLGTAKTYYRGTLLDLSSGTGGNGKYVIHGTSAGANETLTADAILAEDVTVGTSADAKAVAFRKGTLSKTKVLARSKDSKGSAITITAADEVALRSAGIYLVDAQAY